MNAREKLTVIQELGFDFEEARLMASGALEVSGVIPEGEARDVDFLASEMGWDMAHDLLRKELRLRAKHIHETDTWVLRNRNGQHEFFKDKWYDGERILTFEEVKAHTHRVDGFALGCVRRHVRPQKALRGEKNDLKHLDDIKIYTSQHPSYYLGCLIAPHAYNLDRLGDAVTQSAADGARALGRVATLPQRLIEEVTQRDESDTA